MQPELFQKTFAVSRETFAKLEIYHALLLKWQKAINLVSPGTLGDAWARHFADSAQLAPLIPAGVKIMIDLGSGAGFPGLVVAMMRPDLDVHLVESDERKCQFLKTVSRETAVPVTVHERRIEEVASGQTGSIRPDLVTARALAPLPELLEYCLPWSEQSPALALLFLKGQGAEEEVAKARESYEFSVESIPSVTDQKARILKIYGLVRRGGL